MSREYKRVIAWAGTVVEDEDTFRLEPGRRRAPPRWWKRHRSPATVSPSIPDTAAEKLDALAARGWRLKSAVILSGDAGETLRQAAGVVECVFEREVEDGGLRDPRANEARAPVAPGPSAPVRSRAPTPRR